MCVIYQTKETAVTTIIPLAIDIESPATGQFYYWLYLKGGGGKGSFVAAVIHEVGASYCQQIMSRIWYAIFSNRRFACVFVCRVSRTVGSILQWFRFTHVSFHLLLFRFDELLSLETEIVFMITVERC